VTGTDEAAADGSETDHDGDAYEVEVKVRADHEAVRERLAELDADPAGTVEQADTYYDAPDRDFAETDEALRIRRETVLADDGSESETTKLTYKGPLVEAESKTREEYETAVDDGSELAGILDGLRYEPAATVEKHREYFTLDGYTITLDSVTGLGEFLEVERDADEDGIERVREGAHDLLRKLDLDPDEQIRTSYLGLLLDSEGDSVNE
jgi:adenylate cyclase class 2